MNYLKIFLIRYVVFLGIFLAVWAVLNKFFPELGETYRLLIPAIASILLTPRIKRIETEAGKKWQMTWLFLKDPIYTEK